MRKEARKQKKALREKVKELREKEELQEKSEDRLESAFENEEKSEVNEKESNAREGERKERVVKEVLLDTHFNPHLLPICVDSVVKEAVDEKCWDSSNFIPMPNVSSLGHEEKKVNEGQRPEVVATFCKLGKDDYALGSKRKEAKTNSFNESEHFSNREVTCDGFFRLIFDPGGIGVRNLRSNSLEDGGNDAIL